jgi:SnoaL-like domain
MTLEDLIVKQEVEEAIYRHVRNMDEDNHDAADAGFTADAIMEAPTGETLKVADIPKERSRSTRAGLKPRIITNVIVTPTGPGTADAFCYVTLPREKMPQGEWHYKFVRTETGWKIAHYKVVGIQRPS